MNAELDMTTSRRFAIRGAVTGSSLAMMKWTLPSVSVHGRSTERVTIGCPLLFGGGPLQDGVDGGSFHTRIHFSWSEYAVNT